MGGARIFDVGGGGGVTAKPRGVGGQKKIDVAERSKASKLKHRSWKKVKSSLYTPCLKKTVHFCFCQNFVKFPWILINVGR